MLILIGPSASGKTEVSKLLSKKYGLHKIVTYTTRNKRINEVDGVDYNFITLEEFASLMEQNYFVETTYYNQNYYGTAKKDITDDKCVILDPNGYKSFAALNDKHIISVYLNCEEEERMHRMLNRKDSLEDAKKRIINDRIAFNDNNLKNVTFVVDSDKMTLDELANEIYNLYSSVLNNL